MVLHVGVVDTFCGDLHLLKYFPLSLAGSNDKRAKTPPPMNSAAKAKRWL
jgi:hypothetical protein